MTNTESAALAANKLAALSPAAVRVAAKGMSIGELKALDAELSRRAAALGRPGAITRGHKIVRSVLGK